MALNLIGIGLFDEKDITLKGLEAIKISDFIYLEYYTSKLGIEVSKLEEFYGKKIILADRKLVEQEAENTILKNAKENNVSFLVIGDVMSATTHMDLLLRAKKAGIDTKIIHNASVLTAVGITGLELYKFGKTTSIPFLNEKITSPIEVLHMNQETGLHTLFLLDLDPLQDKFMTGASAAEYLISKGIKKDTKAIICCALGSSEPFIRYSSLEKLKELRIDKFPQCLIIPGNLHFIEEEALNLYS